MGNVRSEFNRKKKENEDNMIRSTAGNKVARILKKRKRKKKAIGKREPMEGRTPRTMTPEARERRKKLFENKGKRRALRYRGNK